MCKIKVMLVDDQVLLREGLKTIINLQDTMEVALEASNGREAIELLKSKPIDVILMDIRMPELNGIEATSKIKESYPDISIIVLTTFNEEELIVDALASGADGYLLKDIDAKRLIAAVQDAYDGDILLPSKVAAMLARRLSGKGKSHSNKSEGTGAIDELTDRELEIGKLISNGMTNRQIANTLYLSEGTVKNYISEIYKKLGTNNRTKVGIMVTNIIEKSNDDGVS